VIMALHYLPVYQHSYIVTGVYPHYLEAGSFRLPPLIHDVRMSLFALAVFYPGLFFLFGGKDAEPMPRRPRNWRRIKVIGIFLAGLVVIVGLIAAIIHSHERKEATRQANIEEEASKHRITESEIDLIDLRLDPPPVS